MYTYVYMYKCIYRLFNKLLKMFFLIIENYILLYSLILKYLCTTPQISLKKKNLIIHFVFFLQIFHRFCY